MVPPDISKDASDTGGEPDGQGQGPDHGHRHHGHGHHGHGAHTHGANETAVGIAALLTGGFMVAEFVGGLV